MGATLGIYRGMDQAELDLAYNNSKSAGEAVRDALLADWNARSQRVRSDPATTLDLNYGTGSSRRLDFVSCNKPGAPTLAFIHGGYWQWNDKTPWLFLAEGLRPHGIHFANVDYTLAPTASMGEIVADIRLSLDWLLENLASLGGDPDRLYVSGHSAGGHLTALALENERLRGGLGISGLYDLEPIRLSHLNDAIGMDTESARQYSPCHRTDRLYVPLWISVGGGELPELQRQSVEYAGLLRSAAVPCEFVAVPSCNHFSILEELAHPGGRLARSVRAMIDGTWPPGY